MARSPKFIRPRIRNLSTGRKSIFSPDGRFTKANGHFIKADGHFIKADGRFMKADGRFIKPILAVLSRGATLEPG